MFGLFSRKKTPPLDRSQSLNSVPVVNQGVSAAESDGRLVLTIRLHRRPGLLGRFQPPVMERTVKLDELGSCVFRLIDNQRSTHEIALAFAARYGLNRREAVLSTVEFLKALVRRGALSIAVR